MEIGGTELSGTLLWVAVVLGAVVLVGIGLALLDLARHDVRHLPKWAWALIIVLVNFPVGAIIYLVVGRVPADERPRERGGPLVTDGDPPRTAVEAMTASSAPGNPATPPEDLATAIRTHGLSKRFGQDVALREIDLAVPQGSVYGLIGPNGAGKTTMLSILAGLRQPSEGRIDLAAPRPAVAVLVDTPQFEPWLTAREVVDLARHLTAPEAPVGRVVEVLSAIGLADAVDRRVGGFSRGMLQRLGLAACLVGDPEILVLDEPSSALDPGGRREVLDLLAGLAPTRTVLLSTHVLSEVQQVCDVVGVLDDGALRYQGPLEELLTRTSTVYALQVRGEADALLEELRARPWVEQAEQPSPGRLRIVVCDAVRAESEVPGLLAAHQRALVSFNPATDLETAFLELTS